MSITDLSETRVQNQTLVTTLADIMPEVTNNALDAHPGAALFFGRMGDEMFGRQDGSGRGKTTKGGGESIEIRLRLGLNKGGGPMSSDFDTFNQNTFKGSLVSRANWKMYGETVIVSGSERRKNSGMAQIVDLVTQRTEESIQGLVETVAEDLYNGTGASSDEITGLDAIVNAGATTVQNVLDTTYSKWASRGLSAKGTLPESVSFTGGSFAVTGIQNWRTAWINASEGAIQPHVLLTTDLIYAYYEGSLAPEVRFASVRRGDIGFQELAWKTAPVFHDPFCNSGYTYFLNFDYIEACVLSGADFSMTPLQDQNFQDVFNAKIILEANMITKGRKFQNKVKNQTA